MIQKKIFFIVLSIAMPWIAVGQHSKYTRVFHEYYDEKPIHFGFLFGFTSTNYFVNADQAVLGDDMVVRSPRNFGFQIGGLMNYAFNPHVEMKTGLNIALYDRELQFNNDPKSMIRRESTWLEIPLLVKYRSIRRKNHRVYVIGGVKFGVEANVKKKSSALSANTADLSLEYGVGFENFFQFFKFTPELRFSHGLLNMYDAPTTAMGTYSKVNDLRIHSVTLLLNFE